MYSYIIGEIKEINSNGITIENNGIGYFLYCANPYVYKVNEIYHVYIYQHVREDEVSLYGFKEKEEKELFLKLINVKGLGCKMTLPMFAAGKPNDIIMAIEKEDINYLKKFPKLGDKLARQIVLDLKGKLVSNDGNKIKNVDLIETLRVLGYKKADIDKILPNISDDKLLEEQVKEALKLLLR